MAFDKNVQERDRTVIFKFNGEFNICVTVIEVVQKLSCCVFIGEQGESIVTVSKPNRRASIVIKNTFLKAHSHTINLVIVLDFKT